MQPSQQTKKVIFILEVEIMTPGVQIGSDGKISDGPYQNKWTIKAR